MVPTFYPKINLPFAAFAQVLKQVTDRKLRKRPFLTSLLQSLLLEGLMIRPIGLIVIVGGILE
jgi:hypothetical protein